MRHRSRSRDQAAARVAGEHPPPGRDPADAGRQESAWPVALAGLVIGVALALRVLIPNHMDPTIFVAFGEDAPVQTAYGQALLGNVAVRDGLGHDGRFFFVQANDPFYLAPDRNAVVLDRPIYRAERMLYPVIAGGFGLFPPEVVTWAMLVTNLVGLAIGAFLGAKLATAWGGSPWLGLWIPLNIGLLFELDIGGAGILAYVCGLAALWALIEDRIGIASVFMTAAALAREVMVAFAIGVFILWWLERRRPAWSLVVAPLAALAVWSTYLWVRLRGIPGSPPVLGTFGHAPFGGLVGAFRYWLKSPTDLVLSLVVLAVVIVFVPLAIRSRLPIAWGALPFAGLLVILSASVLRQPFDLSRAVAPIFTAFPFLVLLGAGERTRLRSDRGTAGSAGSA
jgi:hypothetical protein